MSRLHRALLRAVALAALSGCGAARGPVGPVPTPTPTSAPTGPVRPASALPEPTYEPGVSVRLPPADLPHLHRLVRSLVGDAPIQAVSVRLIGHPIDFPAIQVRLAPRPLGEAPLELRRLLVYHLGWRGKHRRLDCPPDLRHGPYCSSRGEVSTCRAFQLRSTYRAESFRPLLVCVDGEATVGEVGDLLRRIERLDFSAKGAGPLPVLDLDTITRIERTARGDTVYYSVTFSRERLRWSVVVFELREGRLRVVRAATMIS